MLKDNKVKAIISSILILLPVLVGLLMWDRLPENMIVHFGADGNPDGTMTKAMVITIVPLILLAMHWLCLVVTALDKSQKDQNKKVLSIVFWIMPCISIFVNAVVYGVALEQDVMITKSIPMLLGVLFVFMGNYMPKAKQNRTFGLKIWWTLNNEENWNKTHRLAGKLWVICGFVILIAAFLPTAWMLAVSGAVLLAAVFAPVVYSWRIYRAHRAAGIEYGPKEKSKFSWVAVAVPVAILIFVGFLMLTGDITCSFGETAFTIEADYSEDLTVEYAIIDEVIFEEELSGAYRVFGFGSPRLSMGTFENDNLGKHTRYTYTQCKTVVILKSGEDILVLNGKTPAQTREIYETILEKVS